ncbi:MAG TPA: helicase-related protein, partial [Gammaproteobacteria bacterium]|nr:helicase-related protein [Gammaproteobacteria bacterium]
TLIDESELLNCQAAIATYEMLRAQLPEFNIALVHGQLKSPEKQAIMTAFKQGEIHLLVATTVIEVGVDVPNASLMIIENAERLGLAQLHQLRGRVGRGEQDSHCILMYQAPLSWHAKSRLDILRKSTDGFKIAEQDLKLRGSGEFLGTRQSGELNFKVLQLNRDHALMARVTTLAQYLFNHHPEYIAPLMARWLRDKVQYGGV